MIIKPPKHIVWSTEQVDLDDPFQMDPLLDLAAQKDPGFARYWFAVALNRAAGFPDKANRWPVQMLIPFDPVDLKRQFQGIADDLMSGLTG